MTAMAVLVVGCPSNVLARSVSAETTGEPLAPQVSLSVAGSHRYSISIDASGRQVVLSAGGPGGIATYRVVGRATRNHLDARFGSRGRINVDFKPSGSLVRRVPPGRCEGKPRVIRFGAFVGTIRFRGEHGYTSVDTDRAKGSVRIPRQWKCKKGGSSRPRGQKCSQEKGPDEFVELNATDADRARYFDASTERSAEESGTSVFFAASVEYRSHMEISRAVFASGAEQAFDFDPGLGFASVSPPPPFSGTATFRRNVDRSTSWKGDLSVSLPGLPHMALVSRDFDAQLVRPARPTGVVCVVYLAENHEGA